MGFWSFAALAVVCGCLLGAYGMYAKSRSRSARGELERLEARLASLESSGDLEDRVRALEAIVTDPKFQLHREIDNLKES